MGRKIQLPRVTDRDAESDASDEGETMQEITLHIKDCPRWHAIKEKSGQKTNLDLIDWLISLAEKFLGIETRMPAEPVLVDASTRDDHESVPGSVAEDQQSASEIRRTATNRSLTKRAAKKRRSSGSTKRPPRKKKNNAPDVDLPARSKHDTQNREGAVGGSELSDSPLERLQSKVCQRADDHAATDDDNFKCINTPSSDVETNTKPGIISTVDDPILDSSKTNHHRDVSNGNAGIPGNDENSRGLVSVVNSRSSKRLSSLKVKRREETLGLTTSRRGRSSSTASQVKKAFQRRKKPMEDSSSSSSTIHSSGHQCPQCTKSFKRETALTKHLKAHSTDQFKCEECGKSCKNGSQLWAHRQRMHVQKFECPKCHKKFGMAHQLAKHKKTHTGERPFKCDQCDKGFASVQILQDHLECHNVGRPYLCHECGASFKRRDAMSHHVRRWHKPLKLYSCELCEKSFKNQDSLRSHLEFHKNTEEGKTPYECDVCGNSYKTLKTLQGHLNRHKRESSFQCNDCKKVFKSKHHLDRHALVHLDTKPFNCPECNRGFTQRSNMLIHQRTHTGEKPYKCDVCSETFRQNVSLKTHKQKKHNINVWKENTTSSNVGRPAGSGSKVKNSQKDKVKTTVIKDTVQVTSVSMDTPKANPQSSEDQAQERPAPLIPGTSLPQQPSPQEQQQLPSLSELENSEIQPPQSNHRQLSPQQQQTAEPAEQHMCARNQDLLEQEQQQAMDTESLNYTHLVPSQLEKRSSPTTVLSRTFGHTNITTSTFYSHYKLSSKLSDSLPAPLPPQPVTAPPPLSSTNVLNSPQTLSSPHLQSNPLPTREQPSALKMPHRLKALLDFVPEAANGASILQPPSPTMHQSLRPQGLDVVRTLLNLTPSLPSNQEAKSTPLINMFPSQLPCSPNTNPSHLGIYHPSNSSFASGYAAISHSCQNPMNPFLAPSQTPQQGAVPAAVGAPVHEDGTRRILSAGKPWLLTSADPGNQQAALALASMHFPGPMGAQVQGRVPYMGYPNAHVQFPFPPNSTSHEDNAWGQ